MPNGLAAYQLRAPTFDPASMLSAAVNIQGAQARNRLAALQLADAQERQEALRNFGAAGGINSPNALSMLSGRPELYTSALGAQNQRQQMIASARARAAQRLLGIADPGERRTAYRQELERGRTEGYIDDALYQHLLTREPTDTALYNLIQQAMPFTMEPSFREIRDMIENEGLDGGRTGAAPPPGSGGLDWWGAADQAARRRELRRLGAVDPTGGLPPPTGATGTDWWGTADRAANRLALERRNQDDLTLTPPPTPFAPGDTPPPPTTLRVPGGMMGGNIDPAALADLSRGQTTPPPPGGLAPPSGITLSDARTEAMAGADGNLQFLQPGAAGPPPGGGPGTRRTIRSILANASAAERYSFWTLLSRAATRDDALKLLREIESGGMSGRQRAESEEGLRREFTSMARPYFEMRDAFGRIEAAQPNPSGDLALIYSYMKLLDPGSVVRETEFEMVGRSQGLPAQIQMMYNRLIRNGQLDDQTRREIRSQGRLLLTAQERQYQHIQSQYGNIARRLRLSPESVLVDFTRPPPTAEHQALLEEARDAISRGAPEAAVRERLRTRGIDPNMLETR